MTSSGGIEDEFEALDAGDEDSDDGGAAGEDGRLSSGGSEGEDDEEGVTGAAGIGDLFCCEAGSAFGDLLELAADTVFCDAFFDFFALASTGEERCNCLIASLGSTGLDLTSEKTTRSTIF